MSKMETTQPQLLDCGSHRRLWSHVRKCVLISSRNKVITEVIHPKPGKAGTRPSS